MRTAKAAWPILICVYLAMLACVAPGCWQVKPGSDPVVVSAEASTEVAFDTVDSFLKFDHDNRAFLKDEVPQVHAVAEKLRREAPEAFRKARDATKVYKLTRNPADGQAANDAVLVVQQMARTAREALLKAQSEMPR